MLKRGHTAAVHTSIRTQCVQCHFTANQLIWNQHWERRGLKMDIATTFGYGSQINTIFFGYSVRLDANKLAICFWETLAGAYTYVLSGYSTAFTYHWYHFVFLFISADKINLLLHICGFGSILLFSGFDSTCSHIAINSSLIPHAPEIFFVPTVHYCALLPPWIHSVAFQYAQ